MQLIDEGDDLPGGVLDVVEDRLEAFLEFAAILRACHHRTHVEGDHGLVTQALRHVAVDDALGQALDDRRLADAGFTDEHRVVLGAAAEHLDDTANLVVPPDDRVEFAFPGTGGEISGVLLQGLVGGLGVGAGHPGTAPDLDEGVAQRLRRCAGAGQQLRGVAIALSEADQEVLGGDVLVVHLGRQLLGGVDRCQRFPGQLGLRGRATAGRKPVD